MKTTNIKQETIMPSKQTTTCQNLDTIISAFLEKNKIKKKRLDYEWDEKNEEETVELFDDFHTCLLCVLQGKCEKKIIGRIQKILAWGGIHNLGANTYKRYSTILLALESNKNKKHSDKPITVEFMDQELTIDPACPVCYEFINARTHRTNRPVNNPPTRLSSWTKVLAAYAPDKFCIYDSRVAIALRFLIRDKEWFIPEPKGQNTQAAADALGNDNSLSPEQSYREYLDLLQDACPDNPGKYEKQLFMLGGVLADMYATEPRRWNQALNS